MIKRLYIYYKERYPIFLRLLLGLIVFGEIYFIVLLNQGITHFNIGLQEVIGSYTVFAFLLWLRVADDLKDYETDKRLFPDRPLPSDRTKISDVVIFRGRVIGGRGKGLGMGDGVAAVLIVIGGSPMDGDLTRIGLIDHAAAEVSL